MNARFLAVAPCLGLALALACGPLGKREAPPPATAPPSPTYAQDVAPILAAQCTQCHQPGGVAPFSLLSYDDARVEAAAIQTATATRAMPPFNPDNSGTCNTYANARWLSDAQIATLSAWVDGGTPSGDLTQVPAPDPLPPLLPADAVALMPEPYQATPTNGPTEDYRCFIVDPQLTDAGYLTGFQVVPGAAGVVHHMGVFSLDTAAVLSAAQTLDDNDPGPGYSCVGGPNVWGARLLIAAGPGRTTTHFPPDTGIPLNAGAKLLFQVHYHLHNGPALDQTELRLLVSLAVAHVAEVVGFGTDQINLAPGVAEIPVPFQVSLSWLTRPATVYGVTPHMHTIGSHFDATLTRASGGSTCVIDVPRWKFGWQELESYDTPLIVYPGDTLSGTCHYDTTSRTQITTYGQTSNDEMCALWALVVP